MSSNKELEQQIKGLQKQLDNMCFAMEEMKKEKDDLCIIAMPNVIDFARKVDKKLQDKRKSEKSYLLDLSMPEFIDEKTGQCNRFQSGDGKAKLYDSVRGKDVYILSDVYNRNHWYKLNGYVNHFSPDDHFMDIVRMISAIGGTAKDVTLGQMIQYGGRQHSRNGGRESLDCAQTLRDFERYGIKRNFTFDVHDPKVENVTPLTPFDNFMAANIILEKMMNEQDLDFDRLKCISPDLGAGERTAIYADMLDVEVGIFHKKRNKKEIVNGKNVTDSHYYIGNDEPGMEYIVIDDMISSGGSFISVLESLNKFKPQKVYGIVTFAMFSNGFEEFDAAYEKGLLDKLYVTNLSYIPEEAKTKEYIEIVDCSSYVSKIINTYNLGGPISNLSELRPELTKAINENRSRVRVYN